jgi:hypothetical protein
MSDIDNTTSHTEIQPDPEQLRADLKSLGFTDIDINNFSDPLDVWLRSFKKIPAGNGSDVGTEFSYPLSDEALQALIDSGLGSQEQRVRYQRELKARAQKRNQAEQPFPRKQPQNLSDEHLATLRASAIGDREIIMRGYRTITNPTDLANLGFSSKQCRAPGLLLPLWTTDGNNGLCVYRPDNPRVVENRKKKNPDGTHPNRVIKYEFPENQNMRIDCPPACHPDLSDPGVPLWITEGQKKADALASLGLCSVGLLGVWSWRGTNELGGKTVLADWENVALNGREVRIVFDSDINENENIQYAAKRLATWFANKKAAVKIAYLPATEGRSKTGVDDWLADGNTLADLEALLKNPETTNKNNKRILSQEYLEVLAQMGYQFRMLELDYTVEVNNELLNDALESEIKTRLRDQGYDLVNVARDAYIAHAYANRYHPIKEYLESQVWDGQDHIGALAGYVLDKDGVFLQWFRKWLIGAVARVYRNGDFNRTLILAGPQDLGKSYLVRWLAKGLQGKYYTDSDIDPENKDHLVRLMNVWIWEVGELNATTRKADRNALKSFLSRELVRVRAPYGRNDLVRPALTSFIATANDDGGFLNDPTGNRRFATCELLNIDWDYATDIDVNQIWAQAKALFDAGEDWHYTGDERNQVTQINNRYEIENPIHTWLEQITELAPDGFATTTGIISELRFRGVRGSDKALSGDIASYMKSKGLEQSSKRFDLTDGISSKTVMRRGWIGVNLLMGPVKLEKLNSEQEEDYDG